MTYTSSKKKKIAYMKGTIAFSMHRRVTNNTLKNSDN